ncbi:MAG: hypothetical protein EPO68_13355 [Planctomycetota bacterium]|nr:MAG: hypothetical protein EPO68_13355 [Planctomycetota bacterium]
MALGGFGPLTIEGCTLSKGNASHSGSAYYQLDGTCTMSNSILWGNGGAAPSDLALVSGTLNVSYCDIEGGWPGAGNVDLDPLFASATNTLLASNSPLIDIGDPAVSGGLDLTGTPRALDGNLDLVQRTDIGAQEFAPVRIAMTGVPSAGQVVQFAATGTPGLLARIVAGAPGAGLTIPPYGTLLVDPFLPMAAVAPFTLLPYSVSPTLPPTLPVGTVLTVQAFGIQFSNAAGAFSNRIQFEVQP